MPDLILMVLSLSLNSTYYRKPMRMNIILQIIKENIGEFTVSHFLFQMSTYQNLFDFFLSLSLKNIYFVAFILIKGMTEI